MDAAGTAHLRAIWRMVVSPPPSLSHWVTRLARSSALRRSLVAFGARKPER